MPDHLKATADIFRQERNEFPLTDLTVHGLHIVLSVAVKQLVTDDHLEGQRFLMEQSSLDDHIKRHLITSLAGIIT